MSLIKITDLTNQLGISSRSLRYYEQIGLVQSVRQEFDKYRFFDNENVERLKQIMVLRKMQISIKDIIRIYESKDMSVVVEVFVGRITAIDAEVNALAELKRITNEFLQTMLKNGIKKISALPLLYEEMDKQLDEMKDHTPITYSELTKVSRDVEKPLDIRVVRLPSMRVLSSYLKDDKNMKSDADSWYQWIESNKFPNKVLGSHDHYEYYDIATNDFVCLRKIPEDFQNNSIFLDFEFKGSLFAVLGTYFGDDIGKAYDDLKYNIENNLDSYMLDYPYINASHIDCLGEEMLSPFNDKGRYDIYMPIKRRSFVDTHFSQPEIIENIMPVDIETVSPVILENEINLHSMNPVDCDINDSDIFSFLGYIYNSGLITEQKYLLPLRVDLSVKLSGANLYLDYGNGDGQNAGVILQYGNWWNNGHHGVDLLIHDPIVRTRYSYRLKANIIDDEFTKITWIIGESHFLLTINNEIAYCAEKYPYMSFDFSTLETQPIKIGSNNGSVYIQIKDLSITTLKYSKISQIKKGATAIMQKQSNNMISELHNLVTWHYGENYPFNGCMQFIMEKIGRHDLANYWLFAGISGDSFTFCYGNNGEYNDCLSVVTGGPTFINDIFESIGYEHTYITKDQINSKKELFLGTVMNYIDNGTPILVRYAASKHGNYQVICGYENNGKTLLFLDGDSSVPAKLDTTQEIQDDWIFIGNRKKDIDIAKLFKESVLRIPQWLTMPENGTGVSFGARGYNKWADDIENGRYNSLTSESFEGWRDYTIYVCNLATNCGGSKYFLDKAYELNPDLSFIPEIIKAYYHAGSNQPGELWYELENLGGGFNVTLEILQDKEKCKTISDKVREIGACMEKVLRIMKG